MGLEKGLGPIRKKHAKSNLENKNQQENLERKQTYKKSFFQILKKSIIKSLVKN